MRISECAKIAFRNLMVAKKMSIKIIIGLSAVVMLLFSMTMYQQTFENQIDRIAIEHKSDCYLQEIQNIKNIKSYKNQKESIFADKEEWNIEEVCGLIPVNIKKSDEKENIDLSQYKDMAIRNAKIVLDGKEYQGRPEWLTDMQSEDKNYATDTIEVDFYDKDFKVFSSNIIHQYQKETGNEHYLIGSLPAKEGEMIISDYMLEKFGIEQDKQKQLIGKNISLYMGEKENVPYFEEYILSGIFDAELIEIREKNSVFKHTTQIMVCFWEEDYNKLEFPNGAEIRYYNEDFKQLTESYLLAKQKKETVEMSVYGKIYSVMEQQISVINKILEYIMIGFVIAVTVYITSIIYFFFQRNRTYFVMLRAIGVRDNCIYYITLFEVLYFILCALVIGEYFAVLVLFGLKKVYEYTIGFDFAFTSQVLGMAGIAAFGYCFVIFFVEGIIHCKNIIKENIPEALKCEDGRNND